MSYYVFLIRSITKICQYNNHVIKGHPDSTLKQFSADTLRGSSPNSHDEEEPPMSGNDTRILRTIRREFVMMKKNLLCPVP